MEDQLKAFIRKRSAVKGSITKITNAVKDPGSLSKQALILQEERLRASFQKYEDLNLEICALNPDDDDSTAVEETYLTTLTVIKETSAKLERMDSNSVNGKDHNCYTKLPAINVPTFTGMYTEFPTFIGLFNSLIHKNNKLDNIQKFFYLRNFLQGEPHDLVKNLTVCSENYEEARKLLIERYDNDFLTSCEHIYSVLDIIPFTKCTASNIRNLLCIFKQQLAALKNLGHKVEQWDIVVLCILLRKLDTICRREFHLVSGKKPTVAMLTEFLEKRALALENAEQVGKSSSTPKTAHVAMVRGAKCSGAATDTATDASATRGRGCLLCKSNHKLFNCPKFKLMPASDRINFVTSQNLCVICLNNHNKKCRFHFKCQVCKEQHNTLLHEDKAPSPVTLMSEITTQQVLLPTANVKLIANNGTEVHVKALLDSGSQASFITNELVSLLQLQVNQVNIPLTGIGNTVNKINESVNLQLHSLNYDYKVNVTCYLLNKITTKLPQKRFDINQLVLPTNLLLADKTFNEPSNIHILLGADVVFQVLLPSEPGAVLPSAAEQCNEESTLATPSIINTRFGYVIAGNIQSPHTHPVINLHCNTCDSELTTNLSEFWKTESVPETFLESQSEHDLCETIFCDNVQLDTKNNKIQVVLPLKLQLESVNQVLGDSLHLALKRFYTLESRFKKDLFLFKLYKEFIDEYLKQGHGTVIDISQYNLTTDPVYFLPHHPVLKLDKKTTKCRVVFDGSMKTNNKTSLNDLLINGPVVQRELVDVLLLFRVNEYFFITDIKNMFRNILLHSDYRSLQNILWRDSPKDDVKCIQLNTVTYGLKSSSYLATRCLKLLADQYKNELPVAAFIINNSTYVDDILHSEVTQEKIVEAKQQLSKLLEFGSFQLHKWVSNSPELLKEIPQNQQHFDEVDLQKNNFSLKTLGINYNTKLDCFIMSCPHTGESMPQSKREILSFISKFYDPLGLAGPIVVIAKCIMQKLWLNKQGWDCLLNNDLLKLWHDFYNSLLAMKPLPIQRHIGLHNTSFAQIIGFSDASSTSAYGCCVYLRVVDSTGNAKISLLCSKSRVNPLSQSLSVPRLELNAALLLAKLVTRVHCVLVTKMHIQDVILYSDSQIVLAWLQTNINTLKAYVANRVKVISQLTQQYTWMYVSTNDNPADCLSRGVMPHELVDHPLWWQGPTFLCSREYKPQVNMPPLPQDLPEVKDNSACLSAMVCTTSDELPLCLDFLEKFSSINTMIRVLAYILRFKKNAKLKDDKNRLNYITTSELNESLKMIVKYEQQKYLAEDIHILKCNKAIVKGNLKPLFPFIDDHGLVRVGGRLENASISYTQKHPIVLPRDSNVTNLIILNEHLTNLHAGPKLVLSSIKQRFWIVHGIRQVKKVLHKCTICFRLKAEAAKQLMGSLPPDRVNACRPFQKVGLDYAGPISLKMLRIRKPVITKGYVCLFVCFVTKAIHLELASDLKTETFIACLNRFISRRGLPTDIYSDNASTFRCARSQLDELYKLHNSPTHQKQVCQFSAQKAIKFHFLPCYSPVFAGLAEAGVKSVKYHLKRVLLKSILTYEELCTVLCQIEAILNSRPLMPLSNDVDDYSCITPGHFLIGTALNTYPNPNVTMLTASQFWKTCNDMKNNFWKVWNKHYLNLLQSRPKWQNIQPNVKIGTLVILRDDNLSPLYWPLARITNIYPGKDGKVRVVEVKTSNGHTHKRAVMKICVLPLECNDLGTN